jgi:hypothetical protein
METKETKVIEMMIGKENQVEICYEITTGYWWVGCETDRHEEGLYEEDEFDYVLKDLYYEGYCDELVTTDYLGKVFPFYLKESLI